MEIKETSMVGTLESGDVEITLWPNPGKGIEIELESDVKLQFGGAIERAVREELARFSIECLRPSGGQRGVGLCDPGPDGLCDLSRCGRTL